MLLLLFHFLGANLLILSATCVTTNSALIPPPQLAGRPQYKCDPIDPKRQSINVDNCMQAINQLVRTKPEPVYTLVHRQDPYKYPNEIRCPYVPFYDDCGVIIDFPFTSPRTRREQTRFLVNAARELVGICEGRPGGNATLHVGEVPTMGVTYITLLNARDGGNRTSGLSEGIKAGLSEAQEDASIVGDVDGLLGFKI